MSAITIPLPGYPATWQLPHKGKVESAIFTIFVVAYLYYIGKSLTGPTPREGLETPVFYMICLLSRSLTIHFSAIAPEREMNPLFLGLWFLTLKRENVPFTLGAGVEAPGTMPHRKDDEERR